MNQRKSCSACAFLWFSLGPKVTRRSEIKESKGILLASRKTLEVLNHLALLRRGGGGGGCVWGTGADRNTASHMTWSKYSWQSSSLMDGPTTQTQRAITMAQQLPLKPKGVGSLCRLVLRSGLVGDPAVRPKAVNQQKNPGQKCVILAEHMTNYTRCTSVNRDR